ncbi:MAG: nucleotidyl transferase AbiEii/AbiGii toxin family protein [Candidatus Nomurabacteria bacterium]|jgi:predicted nucleotidyltransferase component of viral defense system|nr:nucleotidyl transferase AbiEii/AbiGii toxin family protein [Candidatus Nomurabacteria bacterium]
MTELPHGVDIKRHGAILKSILADIYKDNELAAQLVFKGGTCLMLFYGLDRFSTDLDFDIRAGASEVNQKKLDDIIKKYIKIDRKESRKKRFGYTWAGSYEKGMQKVKIDINHRGRLGRFEVKNFMGLSVPTMTVPDMFANKLAAILERKKFQNRDLYDAYFMFMKMWSPNPALLKARTGLSEKKYYKKLAEFLENDEAQRNILFGLGAVLSSKQKAWVKNHLVDSLRTQLLIRID